MHGQYNIGVLVPIWGEGNPEPPSARPIGRVALALKERGVTLVFGPAVDGGKMDGWIADGDGWSPVRRQAVRAIYDRFPDQTKPDAHAESLVELGDIPVFNPPQFTELCRDKLILQRHLEAHGIDMPQVEGEPERFGDRLMAWTAGFLKPRFGSFGRGVAVVKYGEPVEDLLACPEMFGPEMVLQKAVPPPSGWAGVCLRVLGQREPSGTWMFNPGVARVSRTDAVVNAARGAEVLPAEELLGPHRLRHLIELLQRVGNAIDALPFADRVLEMGVDLVLDPESRPVVIEINGRPRGRLAVLARLEPQRFDEAHRRAVMRPFERIAAYLERR